MAEDVGGKNRHDASKTLEKHVKNNERLYRVTNDVFKNNLSKEAQKLFKADFETAVAANIAFEKARKEFHEIRNKNAGLEKTLLIRRESVIEQELKILKSELKAEAKRNKRSRKPSTKTTKEDPETKRLKEVADLRKELAAIEKNMSLEKMTQDERELAALKDKHEQLRTIKQSRIDLAPTDAELSYIEIEHREALAEIVEKIAKKEKEIVENLAKKKEETDLAEIERIKEKK